ncbi:MAG TPA: YXWGXW repeat-containing protein [Opitutus sp.]|nr:YXWGXW repeat-containing protein [Opitutus sp.]
MATQPPQVVATPVATATGQSTVIVTQAPPTVQSESIPARPSSQHVWVPGYWTWRNSRYEWVAGRWTVPPRSGVTWIPPRWEQEGGAYRYYEGYWE